MGGFLDDFMEYQRRRHPETTPSSYALPVRILRETIGELPLPQITRNHIEKACEILQQAPVKMTQRYPDYQVKDAIAAAQRADNEKTLSPRTLSNYYTLIVAIFNYACDDRLISENPAKARRLREYLPRKRRRQDARVHDRGAQCNFPRAIVFGLQR